MARLLHKGVRRLQSMRKGVDDGEKATLRVG